MHKCYTCGIEKEAHLFKRDYKKKGLVRYTNKCLDCATKENKQWVQENRQQFNQQARDRRNARKQRAIEYKGGKCEHCGGVFHSAAFDFHHIDPTEKDRDPGLMMSCSDDALFKELDKCILLCANCHRIHHAKEVDEKSNLCES